jgi:hypothetical protein
VVRRTTAAKKRAFDELLTAIFERARQLGLTDERPQGAIDATGFEASYASSYYVERKGYKPFYRRRWAKLTVVCDTRTHLFPGAVVSRGPSNDSPQFPEAMTQAASHVPFHRILADAAYDGEHNHRLCREELGIPSTVIPLNRRRGQGPPQTRYRAQMHRRFPKRIYGQRWQIESAISQNKRRLGTALRARIDSAQDRECLLRVLTHNLMIIRCFQ